MPLAYKAVEAAAECKVDCVQLFTKNNNQWRAKEITDDDVARFREALAESGVGYPIAHDSYLINMASPDKVLWKRSVDAMVVEMRSDVRRSLGVDWSWMDSGGEDQTLRVAKLAPAAFDSLFVAGLTRIKSVMDFRATLRALAQKGKLHIRANPRVATTEGHPAEIRIAREAFFTLLQGSVTFSYFTLEKIATGITLKITPYVGASAEITSQIETEVSDVIATGASDLPVTSVRSVSTRIRVMNGETIVIGGLRTRQERRDENRIPYLGDIPLVGRLFGHTVTETIETEVVILITPYLMIPYEEFDLL